MGKWRALRMIIVVISAILVVNLSRSIWDLWRRRDVLGERQEVLRRLEAEHARLQKELEYVQSPEFIEQEARNRLGLAREGETVVLMPNVQFPISQPKADQPMADNIQTKEEIEDNVPNWKRWWRLFF